MKIPPRHARASTAVAALLGLLSSALVGSALVAEPAAATSTAPVGYAATGAITGPNPGVTTGSIALDPSRHRVYSLDGDNNIYVFDSSTDAFVTKVPVQNPTAVGVNTATDTIYAAGQTDAGVNQLSVINGSTDSVTQVIGIPVLTEDLVVDPTTNTVWVLGGAFDQGGFLTEVNGATNTVVSSAPTGNTPSGLALDTATHTIWVSNSEDGGGTYGYIQPTVMTFSESTNTLARVYPFPSFSSPADVALDSADGSFFVTNNDDQVIKIDDSTGAILNTVTLEGTTDEQVLGATTGMLVDPVRNTLYVANDYGNNFTNTLGTITVVNAATGVEVGPVPSGTSTDSLALDPTTDSIYFNGLGEIGVLTGPTTGLPQPRAASSVPLGALTSAAGSSEGVDLAGWAVEPYAPTAALTVSVQVDGGTPTPLSAGVPNPASGVADPSAGDDHEFTAILGYAPGAHTVCITIDGVGPSVTNTSLGCRLIQVPLHTAVPMLGGITAATTLGSRVTVSGWAARYDNQSAVVPLTLQFAGTSTSFATGFPDADGPIAGAGPNQGFTESFVSAPGWQSFCILATPTTGAAVQLGCSEIDVPIGFVTLPTPMTFPQLAVAATPNATEFAVSGATVSEPALRVSTAELTSLSLSDQLEPRVAVR